MIYTVKCSPLVDIKFNPGFYDVLCTLKLFFCMQFFFLSRRHGDIMIVKEDNLPRNCWQLAHISYTYCSKDGHTRSVQVVLGNATLPSDGKRKGSLRRLDCPVNKLVLLVPSLAEEA